MHIYDELHGYHFVEHTAAVVSSSKQSQLEHEKGMQWDVDLQWERARGRGRRKKGFR
jgi:hypothetical protein